MTNRALAIISGKGGVGKTSLAVALAQVIASSNSAVLVADFDFLNRGLSELVGDKGEELSAPALELGITVGGSESVYRFRLSKVTSSIYCLLAPPIEVDQINVVESLSRAEILTKLSTLIASASEICKAQALIIDCHGSADALSRTAVAMCGDSLVVCVPEVITFFGTKKILEDLSRDAETSSEHPTRFHVIYNRVGLPFSTGLLTRWSEQYFSRWTAEPGPLAVIPSDEAISIAAVHRIFPQVVGLYSPAVEKLRIAVATLFGTEAPELVSSEARFVNRFLHPFYLPRSVPFSALLEPNIPVRTLIITLATVVGAWLTLLAFPQLLDLLQLKNRYSAADAVTGVAAAYTVVLALTFWSIIAYAARSAVVCDDEVASAFRLKMIGFRGALRVVFCVLAMIVGTVFMISLSSTADDRELLTLGASTAALFPPGVMNAVVTWIRHVELVVEWVSRIYLGLFAIVFSMRMLRSLLFRSVSIETLARLAFVGICAFAVHEYY